MTLVEVDAGDIDKAEGIGGFGRIADELAVLVEVEFVVEPTAAEIEGFALKLPAHLLFRDGRSGGFGIALGAGGCTRLQSVRLSRGLLCCRRLLASVGGGGRLLRGLLRGRLLGRRRLLAGVGRCGGLLCGKDENQA